jgi:signal transduction histidine kinase
MSLTRTLRFLGYLLLGIAGLPPLVDHEAPFDARFGAWVAMYAALGIAFHLGASARESDRGRRLLALGLMIPAMLGMAAIMPCQFGSLTAVIVASQAALVLRPAAATVIIAAATTAVFFCTRQTCRAEDEHIAWIIALLGFQSFAAVAVFLARREGESRRALARVNAELRATQSLLEETSRANERTRIARDLHDVLGHDLTALGLQLEVATHVPDAEARAHVAKARDVSARLLRNVRAVVSAEGCEAGPDVARALRELTHGIPELAVHLEVPERLAVEDSERAHCVLRCVQEVVTNTLRHARARNLWITIAQTEEAIHVDARDDGACAGEVRAGNGLSGMRARVEEMGGWLRVASTPQRPFTVSAWLPGRVTMGAGPSDPRGTTS